MKNYALKFSLFVCYIASFFLMLLFFLIIFISNIVRINYYFPLMTLILVFATCFALSTTLLILFFINVKRKNKVITYLSLFAYGFLILFYLICLVFFVVPNLNVEFYQASSFDFKLIVLSIHNFGQYGFCINFVMSCILGFATTFSYARYDDATNLVDFL